jgi:UDP-N-acetylmuramate--alanine ligase
VPETSKLPSYLESVVQPGDIVITLGAGDVWKAGVMFVESIKAKAAAKA